VSFLRRNVDSWLDFPYPCLKPGQILNPEDPLSRCPAAVTNYSLKEKGFRIRSVERPDCLAVVKRGRCPRRCEVKAVGREGRLMLKINFRGLLGLGFYLRVKNSLIRPEFSASWRITPFIYASSVRQQLRSFGRTDFAILK